MKRRSFIRGTVAIATASAALASGMQVALSQSSDTESPQPAGTIVHSVYFWLKKGLTASEENEFLKFFQALRKVPGVTSLAFGKPAPTSTRDVTDNTFDYNLIITFAKLADINVYETHPEHLKAAQEYSKYWERVQVRDTLIG